MVEPGVVLGEQVEAVVAPTGRSDEGVDVVVARFGVVEVQAGVLIELDQDAWAVDAIVERFIPGGAAEQGEPLVFCDQLGIDSGSVWEPGEWSGRLRGSDTAAPAAE